MKGLKLTLLAGIVLYTIVGSNSCKNVDKVSDTLIFRYNEDQTISTLDPAYIKSQAEIWIATQIYNGLTELDSNLQPVPMLAWRWEILENGLVYKFHLKKGVQFHERIGSDNHKPRWVTARDVVYSFQRILDPATASPGSWIFSDKVEKDGFRAENDSIFSLRLKVPFPAMLTLLATPYCFVIPEGSAANAGFNRNPIGTGPFYLKFWEADVRLVLRRNVHYFEKEGQVTLPYLEAINVDFIKSKQTAFMRFVAGEYDFFNGIEGSFKDELLTPDGKLQPKFQHRFRLLSRPFLNTEYLGFYLGDSSPTGKVLQNVHLRRAMSFAIDRKSLVKYLRNGIGIAGTHGFLPPVLVDSVPGYAYDPARAANELELAGYPAGKGCPVITVTTTADYLDMIVFLKKFWADIGITVNIDVQTSGMLRQMRNKGMLQIFRGSWIADYADPENYLSCFVSSNFSPGGPNYTHYQNPAFDALYQTVAHAKNAAAAKNAAFMADALLMPDAPVMVLYYDASIRLMQPNVQGLSNDATNRLSLKKVRKTAAR